MGIVVQMHTRSFSTKVRRRRLNNDSANKQTINESHNESDNEKHNGFYTSVSTFGFSFQMVQCQHRWNKSTTVPVPVTLPRHQSNHPLQMMNVSVLRIIRISHSHIKCLILTASDDDVVFVRAIPNAFNEGINLFLKCNVSRTSLWFCFQLLHYISNSVGNQWSRSTNVPWKNRVTCVVGCQSTRVTKCASKRKDITLLWDFKHYRM